MQVPKEVKQFFVAGTVLLALLSLFIAAQFVGAVKSVRYAGTEALPARTVTVSGEGEVFAVADLAEITFSVSHEAETIEEAQQEVTERTDAALEALSAFNISESDIKTVGYNAYPRYEYRQVQRDTITPLPPGGERVLVGYEVSQSIQVKVRKAEDAGAVVGALGGANVSNISGPNFTIDDEDVLQEEAREQAIADAHLRAQSLAEDLDVSLGKVVRFEDSTAMPYYGVAMFGRGEDAAVEESAPQPNLPRGENRVTSRVTVTYEIR